MILYSTGEAHKCRQSNTGKRVLLGILDYLNVLLEDESFCNQGGTKAAQRLMSLCQFHSSNVAEKAYEVVSRYAQRGEEELNSRLVKTNTLPIIIRNLMNIQVRIRMTRYS